MLRHLGSGRFSLLDAGGEAYITSFQGYLRPPVDDTNPPSSAEPWQRPPNPRGLHGRLHVCSDALVFEPEDAALSLLHLPIRYVSALAQAQAQAPSAVPTGIGALLDLDLVPPLGAVAFSCSVVRVGEAPSATIALSPALSCQWRFEPLHSSMGTVGAAISPLLAPPDTPRPPPALDTTWLVDPAEHCLLELAVTLRSPFVSSLGVLGLSDRRIYWQPNGAPPTAGAPPVRWAPLAAIALVARRTVGRLPTAIELYMPGTAIAWGDGDAPTMMPWEGLGGGATWGTDTMGTSAGGAFGGGGATGDAVGAGGFLGSGPWALLECATYGEREKLAEALAASPLLGSAVGTSSPSTGLASPAVGLCDPGSGWRDRVIAAWVAGRLSNYAYLMFLNVLAGRSFSDPGQWPVLPWVLASGGLTAPHLDLASTTDGVFRDLTRPMGALNPTRLATLKARYAASSGGAATDAPFLYGTHYSCPAYVVHFCVRCAPAHHLHLQGGKYDAPGRMFTSLAGAYAGATAPSGADVREAVPELYMPPAVAEAMYTTPADANLGVGNVDLPPWACGSPAATAVGMRSALESTAVSDSLPAWIDLIFGCKARGAAALAADNLFHPLAYVDGAAAVDAARGSVPPADWPGLVTQLREFGACPRVLFASGPHPLRTHRAPHKPGGEGGGYPSRHVLAVAVRVRPWRRRIVTLPAVSWKSLPHPLGAACRVPTHPPSPIGRQRRHKHHGWGSPR